MVADGVDEILRVGDLVCETEADCVVVGDGVVVGVSVADVDTVADAVPETDGVTAKAVSRDTKQDILREAAH